MMGLLHSLICISLMLTLPSVNDANLRYLRTVAFSVARTSPVQVTSEQIIGGYDTVTRPDDNHFDPALGVFTSPLKGVYAIDFSFHQDRVFTKSTTTKTFIKLTMETASGGKTTFLAPEGRAATVSSPISVQGASVLLELDKGDKIYLQASQPVGANTQQPIAFSGYLITRILD
ncbi:uncharacterized protein [Asterias amurensis]|uniref:uncharacterized protein n=1 Tax=Asterias amurensis TaxID=7602 RepID=UPI003AB7D461